MWDVKACLACLTTENKLERISDIFQRFYIALTGIKSSDIDGYPMYFCVECHSQIKKALVFKRKCRRAYYVLKEIASVKNQVTLKDITTVNRKRVNLESLISYSKVGNVELFCIDRIEPDVETLITNLDKDDVEEAKCDLVKEQLVISGNVWHIDISPSSTTDEPLIEPVCVEEEAVVEEVEQNTETVVLPEEENNLDDVFNDDIVDDDSEDELPEIKPKAKLKRKVSNDNIGKVFMTQTKSMAQITEISSALSNANIRRLSIQEQMDYFAKAQTGTRYLKASYKCAMCLTIYRSMAELLKHVADHNKFNSSIYMCIICKTKLMDEECVSVHTAWKHLYEYTCKLCENATFNTLENYVEHNTSNHKESVEQIVNVKYLIGNAKDCFEVYPVDRKTMYEKLTHEDCRYECNVCNMKFLNTDYLNTHMKRHIMTDKPFKCDICGVFTSSSALMTRHMEAWHLFVYKCKICGEFLYNRQEAKHHKSEKHRPTSIYNCYICDKNFKSSGLLNQHRTRWHYSQQYCHHCIECGDSFCSLFNLYKHQLTVHHYIIVDDPNTIEDRFPCHSCGVKFLSLKSYQLHALRHRHEAASTFKNACATCRILFDTPDAYQEHITTSCKTLNRYPRKCPYCDLIMPAYKTYRKHHNRVHKDLPLWRLRDAPLCELCGEAVFDITGHMKKHDGNEVDLECRHCFPPVVLRDIWKYCVHMLTLHTPRPFTCGICYEAYPSRRECKNHILKLHSPVKLYKCTTCEQEFSHSYYLNEHCKKFLHPKNKKPKKAYLKDKLYIYPHMKLNVSMFDKRVLESVRMYMCDYGRTKREVISDINDYIVFDKQEDLPPIKSEKKKKYKKKIKMIGDGEIDLSLYGNRLEIVEDDFNSMSAARVKEREIKIEESENNVHCLRQDLYEPKLETIEYDGDVYKNTVFDEEDLLPPVKKKKKKVKTETTEECNEDLGSGLDGQKLNVIEHEGKQYVNLNGLLYEVVHEDKNV